MLQKKKEKEVSNPKYLKRVEKPPLRPRTSIPLNHTPFSSIVKIYYVIE